MPSPFYLELVSSNGGIRQFQAIGQLEATGSIILIEECNALAEGDDEVIRIDLSGVTMISSTGIGGLLLVQEDLETAGKRIEFINLSREVLSVVRLMDLEGLLNLDRETSPKVT